MPSNTPPAQIAPLGSYSKVREHNGFIFVAGTTARKPDGSIAGVSLNASGATSYDVIAQTRYALEQIRTALESVGAGLEDCVDVTVFLTDMKYFDAFNAGYAQYFQNNAPTRTTVAVLALPHPDMVVELKVIAIRPADEEATKK